MKTDAGRMAERETASLIAELDRIDLAVREAFALLDEHREMRLSGNALVQARLLVDTADDMHSAAKRLATQLNDRLPRLETRLKKLQRAIDRAEGD